MKGRKKKEIRSMGEMKQEVKGKFGETEEKWLLIEGREGVAKGEREREG